MFRHAAALSPAAAGATAAAPVRLLARAAAGSPAAGCLLPGKRR
jgi:hypothetical protein